MTRKTQALFDPTLGRQAIIDAIFKLNPARLWYNPVMFVVWAGSVLTTLLGLAMLTKITHGEAGFTLAISAWLWITLLFANFAEALAEGRSKAQASALRGVKRPVWQNACLNHIMAAFQKLYRQRPCAKEISYWLKRVTLFRVMAKSWKVVHR